MVPGQFADAARHDHHEGIDDVVLAQSGLDVADQCQGPSGDPGQTRTEGKGIRVHFSGRNAQAGAHVSVLGDRPDAQPDDRDRNKMA